MTLINKRWAADGDEIMNILMVGPHRKEKGGIATVINNFYDNYRGENHLFYLASWRANGKLKAFLSSLVSIRRVITQQNIQIVHFHVAERGSFVRAAILRKLVPRHVKVIFHMHAAEFDSFYDQGRVEMQRWISNVFNHVDLVVALSDDWQKYYSNITKTEVTIVENAVPKIAVDYEPQDKKIVTVGRLGERKGTYDVLKVAESVQKALPELSFDLYGDVFTEDEARIKEIIKTKKLSNVHLMGWNNDPVSIFTGAGMHFLPSYHEGVPMAILESMSVGIPNLATDVGGIAEVITNESNGYLVNPGDVVQMSELIVKFFSDRNLREEMSVKAAKTIAQRYSIDSNFHRWDRIYEDISEWVGIKNVSQINK